MSATIKFNQKDINRITSKLRKIAKDIHDPGGFVFKYKAAILDNYAAVIVDAMGSVSAEGGSVQITFDFGSASRYWKPLAPMTVDLKKEAGAKLVIWEMTGDTKAAVIHESGSSFAGIDGTKHPTEYERAIATEFGGVSSVTGKEYPGRALFTIANNLFLRKKEDIVEQIRKRIRHTIQQANWGR